METLKTIAMRKSTRSYKSEQINEEYLKKIINAGNSAPVGNGAYDSVHLTIIQNPILLNKLSQTAANMFGNPDADPLYGAPTLILISGKPNMQFPNLEYANAACIIENMMLAATDLGLGSVYILGAIAALHANVELLNTLNLPKDFVPVSGIVVGYPTEPLVQKDEFTRKINMTTI
jgi:nitroreductase